MLEAIIYIHKGVSAILKLSIIQAKVFNSNIRIILIGDNENYKLAKNLNIEHYYIDKFFLFAEKFEKVYQHYSVNPYDFELFCFQRWFILLEFSKKFINNSFLYVDSDTLLFTDVNLVFAEFDSKYHLTVCNTCGPQFAFFRSYQSLENLCNYIQKNYSNPDLFASIKFLYDQSMLGNHGSVRLIFQSISDMTFFGKYYIENKNLVLDVGDFDTMGNKIFEENHYYSYKNLFVSRFPKGNKLFWENGIPFYRHINGMPIQVLGFHLQGDAKREVLWLCNTKLSNLSFYDFFMLLINNIFYYMREIYFLIPKNKRLYIFNIFKYKIIKIRKFLNDNSKN